LNKPISGLLSRQIFGLIFFKDARIFPTMSFLYRKLEDEMADILFNNFNNFMNGKDEHGNS